MVVTRPSSSIPSPEMTGVDRATSPCRQDPKALLALRAYALGANPPAPSTPPCVAVTPQLLWGVRAHKCIQATAGRGWEAVHMTSARLRNHSRETSLPPSFGRPGPTALSGWAQDGSAGEREKPSSDRRTGLGRGSRWELRIQGPQPIWGPTQSPRMSPWHPSSRPNPKPPRPWLTAHRLVVSL